ncbi:MAG: tetratricopeptide repeat protein [Treponema sp.]|jgi:putative GTP pyrophosphokinase|nr:tetratricopeptide repeat protein [Treponema sp.]
MNLPDKKTLQKKYDWYFPAALSISKYLEASLEKALHDLPSRPTVKSRVKDFPSYYKKYIRILQNDQNLPITDLIGIRIICPFTGDIPIVVERIGVVCDIVEIEQKGSHYSFKEFGYESTHVLVQIPDSCIERWGTCSCDVAEIQVRTILQDAWAEVEHELVYKASLAPFDESVKRKLAAVNASLALADTVFQEIRTHQRQLNAQLEKRRGSFFQKIETLSDNVWVDVNETKELTNVLTADTSNSIDALLLNALYAHNRGQFDKAIAMYSHILAQGIDNQIMSIIYRHRGMAHFACSKYTEAIDDFTLALNHDPNAYKAVYYRGIIYAILQQYREALDDFNLSLVLNPYQAFCYYQRGLAYYHIGDFSQALADCESSLSLEPSKTVADFKQKILEEITKGEFA